MWHLMCSVLIVCAGMCACKPLMLCECMLENGYRSNVNLTPNRVGVLNWRVSVVCAPTLLYKCFDVDAGAAADAAITTSVCQGDFRIFCVLTASIRLKIQYIRAHPHTAGENTTLGTPVSHLIAIVAQHCIFYTTSLSGSIVHNKHTMHRHL